MRNRPAFALVTTLALLGMTGCGKTIDSGHRGVYYNWRTGTDTETVLGEAETNIAEYHLARREPGGRSLGVVRVDGALPTSVLEALRAIPAVDEVRQVLFD